MNTALCLYGHFRSFNECWPQLHANLIACNSIDKIFIMAWTDSMGFFQHPTEASNPLAHVGYDRNSASVDTDYIVQLFDRLKPVSLVFDRYHLHDAMFSKLVEQYKSFHHPDPHHRPKGTLSQVYSRSTSLNMARDYENQLGKKFDRIVCTRYDIDYLHPIDLDNLDSTIVSLDGMYGPDVISDAWACGPSDLMHKWGKQFESLDILARAGTLSLGPHEWLLAHFHAFGIPWSNRPDVGIWIRR